MGAQIPVIAENLLATCGCRKFQLDTMGDHLCTCTTHSGTKKVDWVVEQLDDLFNTTHKVKTKQHVTKRRGRHCRDIELTSYLVNVVGPVSLVLDLLITHDRFGSNSDPSLNGHLHYPNDIDKSLNEDTTDKIRKYRSDYNNMSLLYLLFLVRVGDYIVNSCDFYSYRIFGKLTPFLQLQEFRLRHSHRFSL
jgi:hypothetical protein